MFKVIYHFMEKHLAATMYNPAQVTPLITCSDITMCCVITWLIYKKNVLPYFF